MGSTQRVAHRAGARPPRRRRHHLREPAQRHQRRVRPLPQIGERRVPSRFVRRDRVEPGHRRGAARRADEGGPPCRRARARRGHEPRGGRRVHAPARLHRLPHPARRAVADPRGARQRHGAVRDRRRRQLPCVRRRVSGSRHGDRHRRQREDAASFGLQRRRVGRRASSDRVDVPAASRDRLGGCRTRWRRRGPEHRPDGCRHRRRLRHRVPRPQARGAGGAVAR